MFCKNCGKELPNNVSFCTGCGTKVEGVVAETKTSAPAPKPKKGLFKEVYCAKCGNKVCLLTRTKLADGNYICSDCMPALPSYLSGVSHLDLQEFDQLCEYVKHSKKLGEKFSLTHSFGNLNIDINNKLFYISEGFFSTDFYLEFKNVVDFDMTFIPTEFKEGLLGDKVVGEAFMKLSMVNPNFYYNDVIAKDIKAKAHTHFLSNKVDYETPENMQQIIYFFISAWSDSQPQQSAGGYAEGGSSELQQALALFMFDNINEVDMAVLKERRNRLIMTFHPDMGNAEDTKSAQKINSAYEIIKSAIAK